MSADTHTSAPIRGVTGHGSESAAQDDSPITDSLTWDRERPVDRPTFTRPQPRMRQLIGVCGWAAVLGGLGLVVGVRGLIGDLMGLAPSWYEPSMIIVGLVGIVLTVGAFVTVHRRRTPYILLGASTLSLLYSMVLTATAF